MTSPTCIVEFADGQVTRMTVWCPPDKPEEENEVRGITLAHWAYYSRTRRVPPAVKTIRWEARS
jgi:hypothetical protein